MFYTYILKSDKNGSYYIGSCENMNNRINLRNRGSVKSTKNMSHGLLCIKRNTRHYLKQEKESCK